MNRAPSIASVVLCGIPLLGQLVAQGGPSVERTGKRFRVVLHQDTLAPALANLLAEQAEAELQRLWTVLEGAVRAPASKPVDVHLYRNAADYAAAEKAHSPYLFAMSPPSGDPVCQWSDTNGFVGKDGKCHVRLAPDLTPAVLASMGLPQPTRNAVLRVASESALAPQVPQSNVRDFLVRLLAIGTAETVTNPALTYGVDAAFDTRRAAVVTNGCGRTYSLDGVLATLVDQDVWANWYLSLIDLSLLSQHLRQKDRDWAKKLLAWKPTKGGDALAQRKAAIGAVLGRAWTKEAAAFDKMVATLAPQWEVVRDLWAPGKRAMLAGSAKMDACITLKAPPSGGACVLSARVELGPGSEEPLGVIVWYGRAGSVTAFFGDGYAQLCDTDGSLKYHEKASGTFDLAAGRPFDARVEARPNEVRLLVDGKLVCRWEHGFGDQKGDISVFVRDRLVWLEDLVHAPLAKAGER